MRTSAAAQDAGRLARRFVTWWTGELAGVAPARLARLTGPRAAVLFDLGDGRITVSFRRGAVLEPVGTVDAAPTPERLGTEIEALLRGAGRSGGAAVVRVPAAQAYRRVLRLPRAAQENLRQVLAFEMDRRTPWTAEQVYFDSDVVGRSPDGRTIDVRLTVVPRAAVDPVLSAVSAAGLRASAIELADAEAPARIALQQPRPRRRSRRLAVIVLGGAAAALAVLFGLAVWSQAARIDELEARIAAARGRAEVVARLRADVARLLDETGYLLERKASTPSALQILESLSELLPDDTWLTELHLQRGEIRLLGYAGSASALVPLIEQSPRFAAPEFRSSVVRDPGLGVDRFHIQARIETPAEAGR